MICDFANATHFLSQPWGRHSILLPHFFNVIVRKIFQVKVTSKNCFQEISVLFEIDSADERRRIAGYAMLRKVREEAACRLFRGMPTSTIGSIK